MKYRLQNKFDKIYRCVIVVIKDDLPHAWCLCETDPLSIFIISYQSIHYSQFEAATSAPRSPNSSTRSGYRSLAMFRITHMARCLPDHTLSERGPSATFPQPSSRAS